MANKNKLFIPNSIDVTHTIVVSNLLFYHLHPRFWYIFVWNFVWQYIFHGCSNVSNEGSYWKWVLIVILQRGRCGVAKTGHHTSCSLKIMQEKGGKSFNLDWAWIPSLILWGRKCPLVNCSVKLGWWILVTCDRTEEISGWCFFPDLNKA